MTAQIEFPEGIRLLAAWQQGQGGARDRLREIFEQSIAGGYDEDFARLAPRNAVHIGGAINLMTLTIMNDLYGMESREFYKSDPERYVRTTLLSRRLLGMNKLYVSWPVYAFTAEALGQTTMYPDKFPPGSDPDRMLITKDNWQSIEAPEMSSEVPRVIEETIDCYVRLTGLDPILHLSAPYSLAADTFGQEQLLAALVHEPDFANALMDHLVDHVHRPWIDHYFKRFPGGWVELSDASGSPFFIGPKNCTAVAIRAIRRLKEENLWGARIYDANYRGDYVTQSRKKDRSAARRARQVVGRQNGSGGTGATGNLRREPDANIGLAELSDMKNSVCQDFVIRLDDDRVPLPFYVDQAKRFGVPLFTGVGAARLDRHSITDLALAREDARTVAQDYVQAIKTVAGHIQASGYQERKAPWPGTVYFEDVSSESSFELIEAIVATARDGGRLQDVDQDSLIRRVG
ncbi:MAG: hypothetical protein AAF530_13010 [Pseudomonadota bacterium]